LIAQSVAFSACSDDPTPPEDIAQDAARAVDSNVDLSAEPDANSPQEDWLVELRPLSTSSDHYIVDDLDRHVMLRGVNITSLGEYWQGDPDHPPTMPTTEQDWDEMASLGITVIRLVVHWSLIEPERGEFDGEYLNEVDEYVVAAAEHGIYTVIDMHQDAYSAFIFTPTDETCEEGTHPAKGWDGAPAWAVFTDGLPTCTPGDRNASPAVQAAWNHFYDNDEELRDHFAQAWGFVASRFAGRPEVAGYDIINEPEVSRPAAELGPLYDQLLFDSISAIREAEVGAEFEHLVFIEPAIPAGNPEYGLVIPDPTRMGLSTENVVSAPHNYAETIPIPGLDMSFEAMNELLVTVALSFGLPTWIGEYGFWSTSDDTIEKLGRYAADEDRRLLGGAWWQWRQPCGDPHSIGPAGEHEIIHLNRLGCPGDVDLGPIEAFTSVLGRGHPRAAPGRLTGLTSDPATGEMLVEARASEGGGELIVWTPTHQETHRVVLDGLSDLRTVSLEGGRILFATVEDEGPYSLSVEPLE